jgi:hypothetical protein
MSNTPETLYEITASEPRRVFGSLVQGLLGILLITVALASPPRDLGFVILLLAIGVVALVTAIRGWRASGGRIVLRTDGLFEDTGAPIAPLDLIDSVDRALFTFKPAQGFLIHLKEPGPRAWRPGMWWRLGRRVGIGGVTSGAQTKIVADTLSMMVADRDKDPASLRED